MSESEFDNLIDIVENGQPAKEQVKRLSSLICSDAAFRRRYVHRMAIAGKLIVFAKRTASVNAGQAVAPTVPISNFSFLPSIVTITALSLACLFAVLFWVQNTNNSDAGNKVPILVSNVVDTTFAVVAEQNGFWHCAGLNSEIGERLAAGRWLRIDKGTAVINFDNGVVLTLLEGAQIKLASPERVLLSQGEVKANVPENAIGFTVSTESVEIVDLGTEFSVSLTGSKVDVIVHEGLARVEPLGMDEQLIRKGNGVRVDPVSRKMLPLKADEQEVRKNPNGLHVAYSTKAGAEGNQSYPGKLGHDFIVHEPIEITRLGVFDSLSDGLKSELTCEIWRRDIADTPTDFSDDLGEKKLASVRFIKGEGADLIDGSRFLPVGDKPLILTPGHYSVAAYGYSEVETNGNDHDDGWFRSNKARDDGENAIEFVGSSRYEFEDYEQLTVKNKFPTIIDGVFADRYSAGTFRVQKKSSETAELAGDQQADSAINFNEHIRPILTHYCTACHGGVKQAGDVSFVYRDQVLPPNGWVVEPGDSESSILIERIKSDDLAERMPPPDAHSGPVPPEKIALLERWIDEGAKWGDAWALSPLESTSSLSPETQQEQSGDFHQPLDPYVAKHREARSLKGSPSAPPAQWLRRASLDLIGLPPSLSQTRAFVNSCSKASTSNQLKEVYSGKIDELLASEHFGERWASVWMDLARYADSKGFEKDPHRDMWPYRDWLIRAFNSDMSYDDFTIKQLAGDLLPNPTADDLIATAFHRNTQTNTEGGTDDEEFRVAASIDRNNTTWTVWQGMTMGCVQCHSHPYDPIKHDEYYASLAFFNNSMDADLDDDFPSVKVPSDFSMLDSVIQSQLRFEGVRDARNQYGYQRAVASNWQPIAIASAKSSGGQLKIDNELVKTECGTFPVGVVYTVEAAAQPMTGLMIEIFPESDDPKKLPAMGAVLSHLTVDLITKDGTTENLSLTDVFVDALCGSNDPRDALKGSSTGVGEYPKLNGSRQSHFVFAKRVEPRPGATLECSEALAKRAIENCERDIEKAIEWVYETVTTQQINNLERTELVALYSDLAEIEKEKNDSTTIDRNAMMIVANTILNLDKALTK